MNVGRVLFLATAGILPCVICCAQQSKGIATIARETYEKAYATQYAVLLDSQNVVPAVTLADIQKAVGRKVKRLQFTIDTTTPIPANAGTTIEVVYPKGHSLVELARTAAELRRKAYAYGLDGVNLIATEQALGIRVFVRHGFDVQEFRCEKNSLDWVAEIAEELAAGYNYPPRLELFNEARVNPMFGGQKRSLSDPKVKDKVSDYLSVEDSDLIDLGTKPWRISIHEYSNSNSNNANRDSSKDEEPENSSK